MVRVRCLLAALIALVATTSGCSESPCGPSERFFNAGTRHDGDSDLIWESSPPSGPFLPYDGKTKFHFRHELGAKPYRTHVEIAFSEFPEENGRGGSSDATGDLAMKLLQDEHEVVIQNNTCGNYYVRVVVVATRPR